MRIPAFLYNTSAHYKDKKEERSFLSLYLDISPKNEEILEFHAEGEWLEKFAEDVSLLKNYVLKKKIEEVRILPESLFTGKSVNKITIQLFYEALSTYLGEDQKVLSAKDNLCLCFGVSKNAIKSSLMKDKDYDLKKLISETMATSACGSCTHLIEDFFTQTRQAHGLIKGMDHARTRFNAKGEWVKINGLYPGELLLKIDELKNTWMKREELDQSYVLKIIDIEGFHLDFSIEGVGEKKNISENIKTALALGLTDYLKAEISVLFFISFK